jgi:hypothetical protein
MSLGGECRGFFEGVGLVQHRCNNNDSSFSRYISKWGIDVLVSGAVDVSSTCESALLDYHSSHYCCSDVAALRIEIRKRYCNKGRRCRYRPLLPIHITAAPHSDNKTNVGHGQFQS